MPFLDGKPMIRRGETGDWIGTFLGHKGAVWSAHINHTASQVVTGSADYTAYVSYFCTSLFQFLYIYIIIRKLWDAVNGKELHSFTHSKIVKSVHFSPVIFFYKF